MSRIKGLLFIAMLAITGISHAAQEMISCNGMALNTVEGERQAVAFKIIPETGAGRVMLLIYGIEDNSHSLLRNITVSRASLGGFSLASEEAEINLDVTRVTKEVFKVSGVLGVMNLDGLLCVSEDEPTNPNQDESPAELDSQS